MWSNQSIFVNRVVLSLITIDVAKGRNYIVVYTMSMTIFISRKLNPRCLNARWGCIVHLMYDSFYYKGSVNSYLMLSRFERCKNKRQVPRKQCHVIEVNCVSLFSNNSDLLFMNLE